MLFTSVQMPIKKKILSFWSLFMHDVLCFFALCLAGAAGALIQPSASRVMVTVVSKVRD